MVFKSEKFTNKGNLAQRQKIRTVVMTIKTSVTYRQYKMHTRTKTIRTFHKHKREKSVGYFRNFCVVTKNDATPQ